MTRAEHQDRYERVRSIDLIEIVAPHVQLIKRGNYWRGLCPFRIEKTPSFTIYDGAATFKCFGCGQFGNVIDFVVKLRGCSRAAAVTMLLRDSPIPARRKPPRRMQERPTEYAEIEWGSYAKLSYDERVALSEWRGYDFGFVQWMLENGLIANFNGCFAFPIRDARNRVVRLHVRPRDLAAKNWFYFPAQGHPTTPLVFGDGDAVRLFESQWDKFAALNHEWRKVGSNIQGTWIATRGASNAHKLPSRTFKKAYIFAQNDDAGMRWAADCAKKYEGARIFVPPDNLKDVNDLWKRDKSIKRLVEK